MGNPAPRIAPTDGGDFELDDLYGYGGGGGDGGGVGSKKDARTSKPSSQRGSVGDEPPEALAWEPVVDRGSVGDDAPEALAWEPILGRGAGGGEVPPEVREALAYDYDWSYATPVPVLGCFGEEEDYAGSCGGGSYAYVGTPPPRAGNPMVMDDRFARGSIAFSPFAAAGFGGRSRWGGSGADVPVAVAVSGAVALTPPAASDLAHRIPATL